MVFIESNIWSQIYDSLDEIQLKIQFGFKKGFSTQWFLIAIISGVLMKVVHVVLY